MHGLLGVGRQGGHEGHHSTQACWRGHDTVARHRADQAGLHIVHHRLGRRPSHTPKDRQSPCLYTYLRLAFAKNTRISMYTFQAQYFALAMESVWRGGSNMDKASAHILLEWFVLVLAGPEGDLGQESTSQTALQNRSGGIALSPHRRHSVAATGHASGCWGCPP